MRRMRRYQSYQANSMPYYSDTTAENGYEELMSRPDRVILEDPVSKGSALVTRSHVMNIGDFLDSEYIDHISFVIKGRENTLYQLVSENPMKLQNMVLTFSSVQEKQYIKLLTMTRFKHHREKHLIICTGSYENLDNFQFAKAIQKWKRVHE